MKDVKKEEWRSEPAVGRQKQNLHPDIVYLPIFLQWKKGAAAFVMFFPVPCAAEITTRVSPNTRPTNTHKLHPALGWGDCGGCGGLIDGISPGFISIPQPSDLYTRLKLARMWKEQHVGDGFWEGGRRCVRPCECCACVYPANTSPK